MPQSKQLARSRQRAAPSSGGSHLPRAGAVLLTAAVLGGLFAGYSAATRSLRAQPPKPLTQHRSEHLASTKNEELAERIARQYLPEQSWTWKAKNRANTVDKTSFWYWQEWKQESEKVITLTPFAMVSKRKDAKPGDRPYSVSADKAFITFASKVSLLGGNPGAIVGSWRGSFKSRGPTISASTGAISISKKETRTSFTPMTGSAFGPTGISERRRDFSLNCCGTKRPSPTSRFRSAVSAASSCCKTST